MEWGVQTLKLAQVERAKGELRIAASAVLPRKPASGEAPDPLSTCPAWSAQELQASLALDRRFSGSAVACVLPMHLTDLRQLAIPPGNAAERYAMVCNEIGSAQGVAAADAEFDFWEAEDRDSPQATGRINTLSVSRQVVAELTRTLSQIGLVCEVLDGLPFALSRAVGLAYGGESAPTAVLDWGFASSTFCMVRGGQPLFVRHLRNCGLVRLFETVGQTLNLPEEDLAEVLTCYGLPEDSSGGASDREVQAAIAEATHPHFSEIAEELLRTIAYMGTQYPGVHLQRLCLTGDGAMVANADGLLSRLIKLPVERWGLPTMATGGNRFPAAATSRLGAAVSLSALAWSPIHECVTL
jgi:Tfp pilus assembly PilM family ATPase